VTVSAGPATASSATTFAVKPLVMSTLARVRGRKPSRVRKGKVGLYLIANRVRPQQRATARLQAFFDRMGQQPLAWISERAAYSDLAEQGLAVFDKPQRAYAAMRAQWRPVIAELG
jgi:hypothetical protein